MCSRKEINLVTPAKAGVQKYMQILDSGRSTSSRS